MIMVLRLGIDPSASAGRFRIIDRAVNENHAPCCAGAGAHVSLCDQHRFERACERELVRDLL